MCAGQCRIENTPKGWFISLIKEEDKIERERRLKRERAEKGEEERKWVFTRDLQLIEGSTIWEPHGMRRRQLSQASGLNVYASSNIMTHLHGGSAHRRDVVPCLPRLLQLLHWDALWDLCEDACMNSNLSCIGSPMQRYSYTLLAAALVSATSQSGQLCPCLQQHGSLLPACQT